LSGFAPPLPIPDAQFDVVTAFSVFTHIDELESPWLLELRRILKPGGLLYATIHDESQWPIKSDSVLKAINLSENGAHITADSPFPAERTAFHFTDGSYYSCNVFHPADHIRNEWGRFFEVIEVRPRDHAAQSVVLLTPR
jgi:SAM-dependent methyltransferase